MQAVEIYDRGQIDPIWSDWLAGLQINYLGQQALVDGPAPKSLAVETKYYANC